MKLTCIALLLTLLLTACALQPTSPAPALELVFMPGYKPQASLPFVGVYVALEKGFFAAQSLKVTLQASPGQGQHLQLTAAGKVQVTTQDAAVMLQRRADPGLPLVAFALLGQKGQQAFAALESSPIRSPKDWEGRTVGYKGTPPPDLFALMDAAGVDRGKVKLVNVGFDPRLLAEGKVDVYPVFKSNEPYLLRSWGYPVRLWEAADYGVPALGLVYVTSEETLRTQPEALTRFLGAALQGIRYAAANRDEAVQVVMKFAGPETDPLHMRFMLDAELADAQSALTQQFGLGWQTAEQWQALAQMLQQHGALGAVDVRQAFTTAILQAAK